MAGQINRNTVFGEELYKLACNPIFHNFVEIGTWNGQGSTKCLMDGILQRKDAILWSLESNKKFFDEASNFWSGIYTDGHLSLIYGRIIETEEVCSIDDLKATKDFREGHDSWLPQDIEDYKNCPNVIQEIPDTIDVLLLDGGEFTTYLEFQKLKSRTKVIALDDTTCLKTEKIRNELLLDQNWKVFKDDLNDRNGYSIFIRIKND